MHAYGARMAADAAGEAATTVAPGRKLTLRLFEKASATGRGEPVEH
jgi:hypothetical protein